MSIATINARVTAAVTAIDDGDWATAKKKLAGAKALLAVLPSRSAREGEELEFDPAGLDSLLALCNRELAASGGIQTSEIEYVNDDSDE